MATPAMFWLLAALSVPALPAAAQFCGSEDHGCPLAPNGVASSQGRLFAFEVAGGVGRIAELQGEVWTVLSGTFAGAVRSVADTAAFGLVAVGDFSAVSGQPAARVARFDGAVWSPLGGGIDSVGASVRASVEHGGDLYVGGTFTSAGGTPAANVARYDGSTWSGLNGGLNGTVNDLVSFEGLLIAAGSFTSADGLPIAGVAAWDGVSWSQLGATNLPTVYDLEVSGARLYAAGGLLRVYSAGVWNTVGAQPPSVSARSVAAGAGGLFVNGIWATFCLDWAGNPCIVRARFADGVWTQLDVDELAPTVAYLGAAAYGDRIYESGGTNGLRVYSTSPKLVNWSPKSLPWYGSAELNLAFTCADPMLPVTVSVGDGPPLATTLVAPNQYRAAITGEVSGAAGVQALTVTQGSDSVHVPNGLTVLPNLKVVTGSLFAQYVRFFVNAGSNNGTGWVLWGTALSAAPLPLPGVFYGLGLEAGALGVLGSGSLTFSSTPLLNMAVPLGTFPVGLSFPTQAIIVEQTPDGPRYAFTNTAVVVMG